jgi:hypothetical protein
MNISIDEILGALNRNGCSYLLIGGMNFMLRHEPQLTFDVDVWIEDSLQNRRKCETALAELNAEWGKTDELWGPVSQLPSNWLEQQYVYSLITPFGALDVFRSVKGLADWQACWQRGVEESTAAGTSYRGLCDEDMLQCQLALDEVEQKGERIRVLRNSIAKHTKPS